MNTTEIKQFNELYVKLVDDCIRVCRHLKEYDDRYDLNNADKYHFYVGANCVEVRLDYIFEDRHNNYTNYVYFLPSLLDMNDDQLDRYVKKLKREREEEEKEWEERERKKETAAEYAEYERLRKKFENQETESKMNWTKVNDGLPSETGWYLVYAPSYGPGSSSGLDMHEGVMFSKFSSYKNGKKEWSIEVGYHKRPGCVKAWMPIPRPPEGLEY